MASVTGSVIRVDEQELRGHLDEVVRTSVEEPLNSMLDAESDRLCREIRRRTRVVGAFPDGTGALMLVAARLRYVAGTRWGRGSTST
jgi:hypothetical protein